MYQPISAIGGTSGSMWEIDWDDDVIISRSKKTGWIFSNQKKSKFLKSFKNPCVVHRWKAEIKCDNLVKKFLKLVNFSRSYTLLNIMTSSLRPICGLPPLVPPMAEMGWQTPISFHFVLKAIYTKIQLHSTWNIEIMRCGSLWPPPFSDALKNPVSVGLMDIPI